LVAGRPAPAALRLASSEAASSFFDKALRRARNRAEAAGVDMRLVHGDVTALGQPEVGSGYRLVLDTARSMA